MVAAWSSNLYKYMNNQLPANELDYIAKADDFNEGFNAIQAAEWVTNPTDPTNVKGGFVGTGETVWFHRDHFGSGPEWTQVRFADKTLGYVRLSDFKKINGIMVSPDNVSSPIKAGAPA
jgi:hypothetical protein